MKRVLIIGSGGAGKSTLARRMGEISGLPVIHLDAEHWRPGWIEPSKDEWAARVDELTRGESWIMDGNYGGTMSQRIAAADTILFLDLPRTTCLGRVVKRRIQYQGRSRPDMTAGCSERLTWQFVRWIWDYPRAKRPGILAQLRVARASGKNVLRLRSRKAVDRYLGVLAEQAADGALSTR